MEPEYYAEFREVRELRIVLTELELLKFKPLEIRLEGTFGLYKYVNGDKIVRWFKGQTIVVRRDAVGCYSYELSQEIQDWFKESREIILPCNRTILYFVEGIGSVRLTGVRSREKNLLVSGLVGERFINWQRFLAWVVEHRGCNSLQLEINHRGKRIYFSYVDGVLVRKQIYTDLDNKLVMFASSFKELKEIFPGFCVVALNYGETMYELMGLLKAYSNLASRNGYKFKTKFKL
jgi:hypothetical protein